MSASQVVSSSIALFVSRLRQFREGWRQVMCVCGSGRGHTRGPDLVPAAPRSSGSGSLCSAGAAGVRPPSRVRSAGRLSPAVLPLTAGPSSHSRHV